MASVGIALLAFCTPVFAESDAIAVTVSRNVDLSPDTLYISLSIATDPDVSLDQVLQAAEGLGLSARNLLGVNFQQFGPSPTQVRLGYNFDLSVAFGRSKETTDKLSALRRTLAAATPAMELQIFGMSVSAEDTSRQQARQRLLAPLFEEARARADELSKAAGVSLGSVVGVSEAWAPSGAGGPAFGPFGPFGPSTLKTAFSLSVRYAVK
jgi:uncharacterized protein YggE